MLVGRLEEYLGKLLENPAWPKASPEAREAKLKEAISRAREAAIKDLNVALKR